MRQWTGIANAISGRPRRLRSGPCKLIGFGLSVVLLGAVSLAAIPAMIAADGELAWGAIALGQAIGTMGSVVVGYGWPLFGPAEIAGAAAPARRAGYLESIVARAALLLPTAAAAAAVAYLLSPGHPVFAAAGAVSITSTGLTAGWYFVGLARPYAMLMLETVPRVGATAAGIALMAWGHSALILPLCTFVGVLAGFAIATVWVLRSTAHTGEAAARTRPVRVVLRAHRHGLATDFAWAVVVATPLAIVSTVAPAVQPAFALADKVQTQIHGMLAPARSVLQGWVPRVDGPARVGRARTALLIAGGFGLAVGVAMVAIAPPLMSWLGHGQISVSSAVVLLVAACGSLNFFVRSLESAVLAPFGRLTVAARAILAGCAAGLPTVALGAVVAGAAGALGGVLTCLLICALIEFTDYVRNIKPLDRGGGGSATVSRPSGAQRG